MSDDTKTCTKCGEAKPRSEFHKNRTKRDGLADQCKVCARARTRAWAQKNQARKKAGDSAYRDEHREEILVYKKNYREANPEKVAAGKRDWAERNKDEVRRKKHDDYMANREERAEQGLARYEADKERIQKRNRAYYHAHKDEASARARARHKATYKPVGPRGSELSALPHTLYIITNRELGACKVGVGIVDRGDRLRKHTSRGWDAIKTIHFETGAEARAAERGALAALEAAGYVRGYVGPEEMPHGGYTETFEMDALSTMLNLI